MKKSDLKNLIKEEIKRIHKKGVLTEKWKLRPWVAIIGNIGKAWKLISWVMALPSDSRLKKNIRRVGNSPSGIPIYEFEYKNQVRFGGGTFRGVMAEQAPAKSVIIGNDGYKRVDYSQIDVIFESVIPTKRAINEKFYEPFDFDKLGNPGPTFPYNPFDNPYGGMSQGGSNDPMAQGNEEMDAPIGGDGGGMVRTPVASKGVKEKELINVLGDLIGPMQQMNQDIQSLGPEYRNQQGEYVWDAEMAGQFQELTGLYQTILSEMQGGGTITPQTKGKLASWFGKKFMKLIKWVHGLFYEWVPPPDTPTYGSDVRLKENITKTGVSKSGIPTYTFNYKNDNQLWSGTMAQDLLNMGREDAVVTMENGYYGVDYNMIDVDMIAKN